MDRDGNIHRGGNRAKQLDGETGRPPLGIDIGLGREADLRTDDERTVRLGPYQAGQPQPNQSQRE
jgi:hypothetical protein